MSVVVGSGEVTDLARRGSAPAAAAPAAARATRADSAPAHGAPTARQLDDSRRALMRTFLRSRSALASMLTRYGRRARAQNVLISAVRPVVRQVLACADAPEGEDLSTAPGRVYVDLCARRGSTLCRAKEEGTLGAPPASDAEALLRPGVAAEVERRYARLRSYAVAIVQRIAHDATEVSSFMYRYILCELLLTV